jgi:hypothetical protein
VAAAGGPRRVSKVFRAPGGALVAGPWVIRRHPPWRLDSTGGLQRGAERWQVQVAVDAAEGGFNRSSQHLGVRGCDGHEEASAG